jgi:hypothetical protein
MALELSAALISFPVFPHNPENPKTATLYAVLTDPATGAKLEKSIALDVTDEERDALLARAEAAIAEVLP